MWAYDDFHQCRMFCLGVICLFQPYRTVLILILMDTCNLPNQSRWLPTLFLDQHYYTSAQVPVKTFFRLWSLLSFKSKVAYNTSRQVVFSLLQCGSRISNSICISSKICPVYNCSAFSSCSVSSHNIAMRCWKTTQGDWNWNWTPNIPLLNMRAHVIE